MWELLASGPDCVPFIPTLEAIQSRPTTFIYDINVNLFLLATKKAGSENWRRPLGCRLPRSEAGRPAVKFPDLCIQYAPTFTNSHMLRESYHLLPLHRLQFGRVRHRLRRTLPGASLTKGKVAAKTAVGRLGR